jgi:hypothetical protein
MKTQKEPWRKKTYKKATLELKLLHQMAPLILLPHQIQIHGVMI